MKLLKKRFLLHPVVGSCSKATLRSPRAMGSSSSSGQLPQMAQLPKAAELRRTRSSCYEQHAAMYVVRVKDVLSMRGRLRAHEDLKKDDMLILRESLSEEVLVIFVSHQWLARDHPDEKGDQLLVLQAVLRKIHQKEIVVENDVSSQLLEFKSTRLSLAHCNQLLDACVWYDYFCVPQNTRESTVGHLEQLEYIHSIPYYIDSCQVFVALTPSLKNDSGNTCDYSSWLSRGWCRTEMWCKQLSDASDIPVIVIPNSETAHFVRPHWLHYPVPTGDFAAEPDRFHCCQVVQKSLERKLSQLSLPKDKKQFQFFTARFEKMVGLQPKLRSLEEFWRDFALLPGVLQQKKGLSPVACATLAEDTDMVRQLVVAKASIESATPDMTKLEISGSSRPLHLAATFASQNLHLLETLLELRANPNSSGLMTPMPLGFCRSGGAVELLVRYGAEVNGKFTIFGPLAFERMPKIRCFFHSFFHKQVYL